MSSSASAALFDESAAGSGDAPLRNVASNIVTTMKTLLSSTSAAPPTTATNAVVQSGVAASNIEAKFGKALDSSSSSTSTAASHVLNVADLSSSLQHFGWVDYFVFVLMLVVCAVIGIYFGFIEKKQKKSKSLNTERRGSEALDYLVGGRKMKVFPVSLSLVASFVSGISLLGTSTEIYVYGTQYAFTLITLALSGVISWYVFLPVFCNLQLTSTYEYFEMRFDKGIRLFGSILFTIGTIIWLPFVIYVPALAFNQVTGVNIHVVTPMVCLVCIFYTCVGGLKAVVWTDVIQTVIMVGAIILVIVKGTTDVGGLGVVWQRNYDSGRIELPTKTWDPTERASMFSIFFGSFFYFMQVIGGNQVIVQRYLSVPGLKEAKQACIYFTVGVVSLSLLCYYNGLLIFATYYDCDPLSTKLASEKDQLVPLLVMDILSVMPGMPGLFVAGVFSAALSSLSTGLNSLAAVFLEDYIKPLRKTPLSEFQTAVIMRVTVVVVGVISVGLVFLVQFLGTAVLQLSMTLSSISGGPLLGLFLSGLLLPWINSRSALTGALTAFSVMSFICIKGQIALATGELYYTPKPVTTEGCTYEFEPVTANHSLPDVGPKSFSQNIFHMSFLFYIALGSLLTVCFAGLASFAFGRNDPSKMNIHLFAPFIRRFIKPYEDYESVQPDEKPVIMDFEARDAIKKS